MRLDPKIRDKINSLKPGDIIEFSGKHIICIDGSLAINCDKCHLSGLCDEIECMRMGHWYYYPLIDDVLGE